MRLKIGDFPWWAEEILDRVNEIWAQGKTREHRESAPESAKLLQVKPFISKFRTRRSRP